LVSACLDGLALNEKRIAKFVQKIAHEAIGRKTTPNKATLESE